MAVNRARSFLAAFLGLTVFALAAMVTVNVVVDPFWRFDLVNIPGFNAQRSQFAHQARLGKAGVVCRLQPATVILGTSRVEVGIDPTHPALSDVPGPAYNMALAGAGLHELDLTLRHAVHASPGLKRVFLGLDFLMFNANREAVVFGTEVLDFDQRRLLRSREDNCLRSLVQDIDSFLGIKGLIYSFATVAGQVQEPTVYGAPDTKTWIAAYNRWLSIYNRDGFRPNFSVVDRVRVPVQGYRNIYSDTQERSYVRKIWRPAPRQRYCFSQNGERNTFDIFRGMLEFARVSGVDLKIFINPVHARLLIAAREAGLWPLYEGWKSKMVEVLAAEAAASGKPQFPLWDFSGFNTVTTERVPPANDKTTIVKGFWEPSHYKKEIGELMLDRMLGYRDPARVVPDDFGKLLNEATIADWIDESRIRMRDYMRREPEDAALVKSTVDDVLAGSEGSNCGDDVRTLREASAAQTRGDIAAAKAGMARAIALHEADRRRYAELDVPYRETGFGKMLAQAKAGKELKPPLSSWQAYQARGIQRSKTGDHLGAADDFAAAIRIGPVNTALHYLRGVALLSARQMTEAAQEFEKGLKLEPANPTLAHLLKQARGGEQAR